MIRLEPAGADMAQITAQARQALPMWTLYERPLDYPGHYVARMFVTIPSPVATQFAIVADTLEELRQALPAGLLRLDRQPADEPQIVETWF
ncbi:MAG: hypothetical protein B7Y80_01765 [Hyphomicrobium sp. 32-62-53]|nr:MAG: hypothetical protein B7Z29_02115 [Hyphomicrobium sp. 12-62-95]OYY01480.1 MAG: hypothetical protein B7Y80_01765 [Hyphomicrobium sp. 32-62-53]